jgi:hypothetical protein
MKRKNKKTDYTIELLIFCFLLALLFNLPACYKTKTSDGGNLAPLRSGQILYPDYVHLDTLIVVNAALLNEGIDKCDGTDYEIAGLLYRYCVPMNFTMPEYGLDIDNEGYDLYDYSYKNSIRSMWGTNFDSLLDNWND